MSAGLGRIIAGFALLEAVLGISRKSLSRAATVVAVSMVAWAILMLSQERVRSDFFHVPLHTATTLGLLALSILYLKTPKEWAQTVAPWLAIAGIWLNSAVMMGHIYGSAVLYSPTERPVGIPAAMSSIFLCLGVIAAAGAKRMPLRILVGENVTARIVRTILPVTFLSVLLGELASDMIRYGDALPRDVREPMQTLVAAVIFSSIVLFLARRAGAELEQAEQARDQAEAALVRLNQDLEGVVAARTAELRAANEQLISENDRRRRIEAALRESECKSQALLRALPDAVFRVRTDGKLLDMRAPAELRIREACGYEQTALESVRDRVTAWVRENSPIETEAVFEFNIPMADDERRTFEARFAPSGAEEALAVVRDITEISRLENEVMEASAREQQRIGEELHDGVGQQLTALAFMSKNLESTLREKGHADADQAEGISKLIVAAMKHIRGMARGLFHYELGEDALIPSLRELASNVRETFRVDCALDLDETVYLPDRGANLHIFRIAQEAVANALKHGQATRVEISLRQNEEEILFAVEDNGVGTTLLNRGKGGIGLRTMEFRTRRMGGRLTIDALPGEGTRLTCALPRKSQTTNKT